MAYGTFGESTTAEPNEGHTTNRIHGTANWKAPRNFFTSHVQMRSSACWHLGKGAHAFFCSLRSNFHGVTAFRKRLPLHTTLTRHGNRCLHSGQKLAVGLEVMDILDAFNSPMFFYLNLKQMPFARSISDLHCHERAMKQPFRTSTARQNWWETFSTTSTDVQFVSHLTQKDEVMFP